MASKAMSIPPRYRAQPADTGHPVSPELTVSDAVAMEGAASVRLRNQPSRCEPIELLPSTSTVGFVA